MKKAIFVTLILLLCLSLSACSNKDQSNEKEAEIISTTPTAAPTTLSYIENIEIKSSPDKYTWYIKNYVGKNAASIGYISLGGDRLDTYGNGYLRLVFVAPNGQLFDARNEEELKQWRVIGQNMEPNTELKYTYALDSEGQEYDNLVAYQNYEEIVLAIGRIGEDVSTPELTFINPSDRYTSHIRDYVGRTLDQCGYISLGGDLMDQYGSAYVRLAVYAEDGSFIELEESEKLKNYAIVSQSVAPNTELTVTYMLDGEGNEYDNLVDTQNVEEVELFVIFLGGNDDEAGTAEDGIASDEDIQKNINAFNDTETVDSKSSVSIASNGLRPEFKEAMDSYEAFYDEYCDFMIEYKDNPTDLKLLSEYTDMLIEASKMEEAFEAWEDEEMSNEELTYYLEVTNRITEKLLDAA